MGEGTRFALPGIANQICCDLGCGVPKKLLCLKNGKYVKDSYKCRKVPNYGTCDPCKCLKCVKPKRKSKCKCKCCY